MILDSEEQRDVLLGLLNAASFRGANIDEVFALKSAIRAAQVDSTTAPTAPAAPAAR